MSKLKVDNKVKNSLLIIETLVLVLLVSYYLVQKNEVKNNDLTQISTSEISPPNDEKDFPPLNLPIEYFLTSERPSIGAGAYSIINDEDMAYRSYPSTKITLSNDRYSVIPIDLPPIKSDSKIHTADPSVDFMGSYKTEDVNKYGDIARRYIGEPGSGWLIQDIQYTDVDGDGEKEQILSLYEMGANIIGGRDIVIKDNKEIFSTAGDTFSSLKPAEDGNGFFLSWDDNFKMRDGYVTTRFIFEDGTFKPIYEQKVRYIRIQQPK